jgi:excisionase family DNA binding protein
MSQLPALIAEQQDVTMLTTAEKLLTVRQVAAYLGAHEQTIYKLIRNGELRAFQPRGPGHSLRISERELESWLHGAPGRNGDNGDEAA